ncbi:MAG: 16S rRNA (guanine(527)-N(7))-methyltransferase RsmG [Clostridia bacterium]|nr:16S rRNA (guanine(527)-N(7))-methyltransferase RsmG [Clostridia bacterium]
MEFKALIQSKANNISDEAAKKFERYFELLTDWNTRLNLTAITEAESVIEKHFLDSILPSKLIPKGSRCIDIGTGAGFPGIPLAIIRPDIEMVLLDSLNKRVNFLNAVKNELQIPLVCIHARGEDAANDLKYREKFDVTLSRAVASINALTEVSVPYLKVGGVSVMLKGPKANEELEQATDALKALKASAQVVNFDVPWGDRCAVVVRKEAPTPKGFPRKGMFKKPL